MTIATAVSLLAGCSNPTDTATTGTGSSATDTLQGDVSVYAAASLQEAFEELSESFTKQHPGVSISLTFDGSSTLATQIIGGAHADVFASADEPNMRKVVDGGLAGSDPTMFATSELVIVVAPGNPLGITTLADLAAANDGESNASTPVVVTCAPEVPCGAAAHTLLERDSVSLVAASEEQNVTAVLTKVQAGEADAGLVYASDALRAEGTVEGIAIAGSEDAAGSYMINPIEGSNNPTAAAAFTEFVASSEAQTLFTSLGFHTK